MGFEVLPTAPATSPAVQLINVTKRIGARTIIHDLDLAVRRGEVFGLLGPNGAGKTTTIRMIVGLISITRGEILIEGRSIRTDFTEAVARVGAVVENPEFYGFLTGYQTLVHFMHLSRGVTKARIEEVVSLLGMGDYIQDKVSAYSLGMRQRLGIAQALLHRPAVLILDEPTNGLDPNGIKELREHLRRLAADGKTAVIVSSHILAEMELMCDRIAVIKQGRLLGVKSLNETADLAVRFTVDNPEKAMSIIGESFPGIAIEPGEGALLIGADRGTVARINAALTASGVGVYAIEPNVRKLEEIFMELTADA